MNVTSRFAKVWNAALRSRILSSMRGRTALGLAFVAAVAVAGCRPAGAQADRGSRSAGAAKTTETAMTAKISNSGFDITQLPREAVARLAARLDPEAYRVTQKAGTEAAFCGNLLDNHKDGVYACVVCGLPLFSSEHRFNSGTGWPSFYQPFDPEHIVRKTDTDYGMVREEILCARCG
jgi:methionine-R-sulfoxide reductase